jgi:multidrug transporter EmrE-like cation transporter
MKAAFPLVTMIGCTVVANLLMKLGSQDAPSPFLLGLLPWRTAGGLIAFGCAGLLYATALRFLALNVAQSYAAIQFMAVIVASRLILGEPIAFMRWAGISMIALGIIVVALSEI